MQCGRIVRALLVVAAENKEGGEEVECRACSVRGMMLEFSLREFEVGIRLKKGIRKLF